MKNNLSTSLKEFKPALRFLLVFIGVYIAGNVIYGVYVEWYKPLPDPVTRWVTTQSAILLTAFSEPVEAVVRPDYPHVLLTRNNETILSVFEGCNGINVMIVFASFLIAFGGKAKQILVFLLMGCLILHLANLLRLTLLYLTAIHRPLFFYYFHKYFFTAILYLVVFALWIQWTRMKPKISAPAKA